MELERGRKHPAHMPPVERHNEPIIIFLTVCTDDRKEILATTETSAAIVSAWRQAGRWLVGRYVIMPDHIHLFCAPATIEFEPLKLWVRYWKNEASKHWPRIAEHPIWQRDFWDTQLRRHESYAEKWEYVRNNPVRAGLVTNPDACPFQGELSVLQW